MIYDVCPADVGSMKKQKCLQADEAGGVFTL